MRVREVRRSLTEMAAKTTEMNIETMALSMKIMNIPSTYSSHRGTRIQDTDTHDTHKHRHRHKK